MKKFNVLVVLATILPAIAFAQLVQTYAYKSVSTVLVDINPYTDTTYTIANFRKVYVYNPGIAFRVAYGDVTTADTDAYMPVASSEDYKLDGLALGTITFKFIGEDTSSDTGSLRLEVYK